MEIKICVSGTTVKIKHQMNETVIMWTFQIKCNFENKYDFQKYVLFISNFENKRDLRMKNQINYFFYKYSTCIEFICLLSWTLSHTIGTFNFL